MAQILDGAPVRDAIYAECRPRIAALPRTPGLAVMLMGAGQVVFVGKSVTVAKRFQMLLSPDNASVTMPNTKLRAFAEVGRQADFRVAGVGRPAALTGDFISPGAAVIDVGVNRITD